MGRENINTENSVSALKEMSLEAILLCLVLDIVCKIL